MRSLAILLLLGLAAGIPATVLAQSAVVAGTVVDETGGALPGVAVQLRAPAGTARETTTDSRGHYAFAAVAAGSHQLVFGLVNFGGSRRDLTIPAAGTVRADVALHLALNADVTVTGKRTFTNLADAADPAGNLIGIAQSASQGAITARQLDARPIMRSGEVLETVPGVVISQHSGEGKANQYYLRGFNLDHGTDFATTVAGMPVNMPTHGHGHGYSDANFLIPELVSGVQFSKGPYFADQGDFATAGAANINYVNASHSFSTIRSHGDQFHQADRRVVSGLKASHRRLAAWGGRPVQNSVGVQVRNDDIGNVGLSHTQARQPLDTVRQDAVVQTSAGVYAQNETEWTPWLRTLAGSAPRLSLQGRRGQPGQWWSGACRTGQPESGRRVRTVAGQRVVPERRAGLSQQRRARRHHHRGPVVGCASRARHAAGPRPGAEVGLRTVAVPHLQTSVSLWTLALDSELIFVGDAGTTEAGRPSRRSGIEIANYYTPAPWLVFDADLSLSIARFRDQAAAGPRIPGAVETVVSAGATVDTRKALFGSLRLRYFGPRALTEADTVRSKPTSLLNGEVGYRLSRTVRIALDLFNIFNATDSDVDYFYTSRLPGEPAAGVEDIHFHATLPRTARLSLIIGF